MGATVRREQSADGKGGIDNELQKLEQEVSGEELGLTREIARITDEVESIRTRLAQARDGATQASRVAPDPAISAIQQRSSVELQPMQTGPAHEKIRTARRRAVELRRQAVIETRAELQRFAEGLAQLSRQLEGDEAALRQFEQRQREAQERQRQEDEERRRARENPAPISPPAWDVEEAQPIEAIEPIALTPKAPPKPPPVATAPPKAPAAKTAVDKPGKPANRGLPRVKMQAAVDLESESNFFQGFSMNLSEGGIFVATVNTLPLGTKVDLHFTLPGSKRIDVQGVVRWTREVNDKTPDIFPGVGIQFQNLSQDAEAAIQQFVKGREPLFFPD